MLVLHSRSKLENSTYRNKQVILSKNEFELDSMTVSFVDFYFIDNFFIWKIPQIFALSVSFRFILSLKRNALRNLIST